MEVHVQVDRQCYQSDFGKRTKFQKINPLAKIDTQVNTKVRQGRGGEWRGNYQELYGTRRGSMKQCEVKSSIWHLSDIKFGLFNREYGEFFPVQSGECSWCSLDMKSLENTPRKSPCITSSPFSRYDAHVDIVGVTSDNRSKTIDKFFGREISYGRNVAYPFELEMKLKNPLGLRQLRHLENMVAQHTLSNVLLKPLSRLAL